MALSDYEWLTSVSSHRTFYSVPTANLNGVFGPIYDYEGPRPRLVYHFKSNGALQASDSVAIFSSLSSMAAVGDGNVTITDARGNVFTGAVWGLDGFDRPNPATEYYQLSFNMTDPQGSITN